MILNLGEWPRRAVLSYSGTYTTKTITVNGKSYTLYSFTGSGTLSVSGGKLKNADIWACGGGGSPPVLKTSNGGGGGYTSQMNGQTLLAGEYAITIGAAEGDTSITRNGTAVLIAKGAPMKSTGSEAEFAKGGSGGGRTGSASIKCPGQGTTTRPFGDSTNFPSLPCAGGGGAGGDKDGSKYASGGKGGSNGSDGGLGDTSYYESNEARGGAGGATGGGTGSSIKPSYVNPTAATYYGSGGGGQRRNSNVGYGYQGWLLIRVPV